jgi:hypothetical protein
MVHHHHGRRGQSRLFNLSPLNGELLMAESLSYSYIITLTRARCRRRRGPQESNAEGASLDLEGLFENLGQVVQNGGLADD